MRTALIVSISLGWIASAALAQTVPPSPPPKATDKSAPPASGPGDKKGKFGPENPTGKGDVTDALASCLAMWEPATHMSRQEWARACRRVADRLKNTVLK